MSGVAGRAGPKIAADRAVIQISRPIHQRLTAIKLQLQHQLHRQVSYTEIIEQLLDRFDAS